jgi:hypothetical protein
MNEFAARHFENAFARPSAGVSLAAISREYLAGLGTAVDSEIARRVEVLPEVRYEDYARAAVTLADLVTARRLMGEASATGLVLDCERAVDFSRGVLFDCGLVR